jgi:PAS domain S-box-containing protein
MEKPIGKNNLQDKGLSPALQESFQHLDIPRFAIDSANIGIWIMDTATGSFLPSRRTKELFGFLPEDEMSFNSAMMQVADKERKNVTEAIENAIAKQLHLYLEFPLTGPHDKKQKWLSLSGGFSNSDEGNGFFSGIMMDITEQKQNDLRRSRFIGIVSHELKPPLTALKAYVQMLNNWAKKQKDSFTIGALSKVDRQVKKMLNMINGQVLSLRISC